MFRRHGITEPAAAVCTHLLELDFPQVIVEDTRKALRDVAASYKETIGCKTVAITGSVGKTTTRTMICTLLAKKYHTCGTVKNYNNDIGLPVTIGKSDPDCEMLVLEMGMNHFGEMRQLTAIGRPDTVLITNIGSMHIENLGSREGILKAKLEILEGLHPGGMADVQRRRTPFVESPGRNPCARPCTSALRTRTAMFGAWILS